MNLPFHRCRRVGKPGSRPTASRSAGSAKVCGLDPLRNARKVKRLVGYLPENVGFYQDMDAVQSMAYIADLNGMDRNEAADKILEVLDTVGLSGSKHKKVGAFSRGMRQRLGIAEVLLKDPKVMFLDEPTLGLDPEGALKIIDLIKSLNADRKMSVLLSSHHLQQVQKISHRVGIMIEEAVVRNVRIKQMISLFSPMSLYTNASATIIDPMRKTAEALVLMGPLEKLSAGRFQNPLPLGQSILVVYPYIVVLIALKLVCFAISYLVFMVQEIRTQQPNLPVSNELLPE